MAALTVLMQGVSYPALWHEHNFTTNFNKISRASTWLTTLPQTNFEDYWASQSVQIKFGPEQGVKNSGIFELPIGAIKRSTIYSNMLSVRLLIRLVRSDFGKLRGRRASQSVLIKFGP